MRLGESQHLPCASLIAFWLSWEFVMWLCNCSWNKGVTGKTLSLSVQIIVWIISHRNLPVMTFFPPQAYCKSLKGPTWHTIALFIVPIPLPHFIDPQNKLQPLLTSFLSWWPLSLLPGCQMEPVSIGAQYNLTHLLHVNRWTTKRWIISHGARMHKIAWNVRPTGPSAVGI